MVLLHCGRHDERPGAIGMGGIVHVHIDAESAKIFRLLGMCVAPRDDDATPHEELSERTHPRAGNTDEVDGALVVCVEEWGRHAETNLSAWRASVASCLYDCDATSRAKGRGCV